MENSTQSTVKQAKATYLMTANTEDNNWKFIESFKNSDEAAPKVSSTEIYELSRAIQYYAAKLRNEEHVKTLTVGKFYYYRGRRGISYWLIVRIDGDKVYALNVNKAGSIIRSKDNIEPTQIDSPSGLTEFKKQPK